MMMESLSSLSASQTAWTPILQGRCQRRRRRLGMLLQVIEDVLLNLEVLDVQDGSGSLGEGEEGARAVRRLGQVEVQWLELRAGSLFYTA